MWIAVVAVLLFNVLRFASLDYAKAGFVVVALWILIGLLIGFAEEVLTRGLVVNIMRKAGHGETAVALVFAGLFALLHSVNLLSGEALGPTLLQLGSTSLRYPHVPRAARDWKPHLASVAPRYYRPCVFLLATYPSGSALCSIASLGNLVVIAAGLVLVFFIRGRVADDSGVAL